MSHTFDSMLKEATALPWTMGARLMVELRSTVRVPEQPVMTKEAALGLVKIARIVKQAKDPDKAQLALQQAAMTDPSIVQAMDYQQAENERQMLMAKVQELQMVAETAQAQAAQADQQAQAAMQQQEQLTAAAQQAKQEQVNAVMESMQAKDQTLQTQVSAQQHRQQIAGYAQQMADQLKQIASTSPEEQQMQQEQAAAEQQAQQQAAMQQQGADQQAQGQPAQQGQPPAKSKTKKETDEAQKAQQKAQEQTAQAQQAQQEEAQQPQPPQAAMPPKMGSAKLQKVANAFYQARLQKQAAIGVGKAYKLGKAVREMGKAKRIRYMGESTPAKEFVGDINEAVKEVASIPERMAYHVGKHHVAYKGGLIGGAVGTAAIPIAKRLREKREKTSQFSGSNEGAGESQGGIGQQGGFAQYASMGKTGACGGCGKMSKISNMGKCAKCSGGHSKLAALMQKLGSEQEAARIGVDLGVKWGRVDFTPADLAKGMEVEKEHHQPGVDVMPGEEAPTVTAKIALAHLKERGDYYDLLEPKVEKAPGDKVSEDREKVGFSKEQAMMIAQRVRLIKEGQLKKASRGSADVAESRHITKEGGAEDAARGGLGHTLGYAALGAAIGGGISKARMKAHEQKFGLDQPTGKELKLHGELAAAEDMAKRDPSYSNKLRISNLQYKIDMEKLDREHPNRASVRGATRGALIGAVAGPLAHRLLGKVLRKG